MLQRSNTHGTIVVVVCVVDVDLTAKKLSGVGQEGEAFVHLLFGNQQWWASARLQI